MTGFCCTCLQIPCANRKAATSLCRSSFSQTSPSQILDLSTGRRLEAPRNSCRSFESYIQLQKSHRCQVRLASHYVLPVLPVLLATTLWLAALRSARMRVASAHSRTCQEAVVMTRAYSRAHCQSCYTCNLLSESLHV